MSARLPPPRLTFVFGLEATLAPPLDIPAAMPALDLLSKGIFVGVGGRGAEGAIYETYLVG